MEPKKAPPMVLFYWVIGVVVVVGTAIVLASVTGKDTTTSAGTDQTNTPTDQSASTSGIPTPQIVPPTASSDEGTVVVGQTSEGFYYRGAVNAPVTVMVYSDFQCPACAYHAQTTDQQLETNYVATGKVRLVFHDFPLPMHPNAPIASQAARCAGEQGTFWEMHDSLFLHQDEWAQDATISRFGNYASEIGLDSKKFEACLEGGTYANQVAAAGAAARAANIGATPTYVVNGKEVTIDNLFTEIDAALAATGQ